MSRVDPITLEVIRNGLASIADEMALIVMRSAYSPVVRDIMDYSTALCDPQGRVIAQGLTLPIQLCSFPRVMRFIQEQFGDDIAPGDVFITNDPYGVRRTAPARHLRDEADLRTAARWPAIAATVAHHTDVGGIVPGSVAIYATEIQQEGLRIPLLKLYEAGQPNETLFDLIDANTRQPVEVLGDLRAQIAACTTAERGLSATGRALRRRLSSTLYVEALHDHAEAMMRDTIRELPNGVYVGEDYLDGIGETSGADPHPRHRHGHRRQHRHRLHRHLAARSLPASTARSRCRNRQPSPRSAACRAATSPTATAT